MSGAPFRLASLDAAHDRAAFSSDSEPLNRYLREQVTGRGLGGPLLADALDRAARSEIAAFALMVDAKDEAAAGFYRHHGFIVLPDSPPILFVPLATVQRA